MTYVFTTTVAATAGGSTFSRVWVPDTGQNPFNIGIGVKVDFGGNSAQYTVQHTFDDPFGRDLNASGTTWYNHEFLVSGTSSDDGNYAFPVRGVRFFLTSAVSAQAVMTLVQAGPR